MALAVAVGRGAAGRAALVAGRGRGADPGQAGPLGAALLGLFGLRLAVLLPAEDRRHVVQRKDLYSGKNTHSFRTLLPQSILGRTCVCSFHLVMFRAFYNLFNVNFIYYVQHIMYYVQFIEVNKIIKYKLINWCSSLTLGVDRGQAVLVVLVRGDVSGTGGGVIRCMGGGDEVGVCHVRRGQVVGR